MKVLVTGVAGQLGHDVMNELAGRGYEESDQISRKCTAGLRTVRP